MSRIAVIAIGPGPPRMALAGASARPKRAGVAVAVSAGARLGTPFAEVIPALPEHAVEHHQRRTAVGA